MVGTRHTRAPPGDTREVRIIADIGGTNARFALIDGAGQTGETRVLKCADYSDPVAAAGAFLDTTAPTSRPMRGAFAVASPVAEDQVTMTNHPWSFSVEDVRRRLGLDVLRVVNDFAAIALAIPYLGQNDCYQVGGGEPVPDAPVAVLGPGTGLGASALVPAAGCWAPLATEGGHVTMAAFDEREAAVLANLRRTYDHVSAERVISGPGLVNLYRSLCALDGRQADHAATPDAVSRLADDGTCPAATEALEMFCAMLGTVASDLALSLGALGGVYIAGGIVPKLGPAFAASGFRRRFEDKGRFAAYLAATPVFVITHPLPAFVGLGAVAGEAADKD
ncbi:MAG: glucokinase [Rhodospirillales bacterium]|jgi:glucokinase|nr:glucokinase [Rhodospirillales bacterium]HJO96576.1 glucokinase [Rhodospirillales bacterium]